jgi:hypothetical protein
MAGGSKRKGMKAWAAGPTAMVEWLFPGIIIFILFFLQGTIGMG